MEGYRSKALFRQPQNAHNQTLSRDLIGKLDMKIDNQSTFYITIGHRLYENKENQSIELKSALSKPRSRSIYENPNTGKYR